MDSDRYYLFHNQVENAPLTTIRGPTAPTCSKASWTAKYPDCHTMIGNDTRFLVAWAIPEYPDHLECRSLSEQANQRWQRLLE